jgi:hypothetical protein
VPDEHRQEPAVVEVGVGQDHGVEGRRVEAERHAVPDRLGRPALEHPAVDEDPGAARVDEVPRARHGLGAAEERELESSHARIVTHGPARVRAVPR